MPVIRIDRRPQLRSAGKMKHVVWKEGASGPGIDEVRTFLREYNADALKLAEQMSHRMGPTFSLPASGPFDFNLRMWVRRFQIAANAKLKKKRLPENGDVDWATRRAMGIDEALADDEAIKLPEGVQAYQLALTASELEAGKRGERFDGRAYRVANLDKLLAALGLGDTKIGTTSDKRIAPLEEGPFLVPQGHVLYGAAADKSECAALVQSFGVSNTNRWRRGPRVQDIETLEPGTVIATLGSGVYLSDYSGKSHVGIFLRKDDLGLVMLDQFRGGEGVLGIRYKKFGAKHKRTRVKASKFIDSGYSYRMEVRDAHGKKKYARDYSLDTVRYRENLTGDGSEYYVLLDNGSVVREDSDAHKYRTPEENRQAAKELVAELFDGIDIMGPKDAGEKLRKALEGVKPATPADMPLQPR
jgi:hypothetical protein